MTYNVCNSHTIEGSLFIKKKRDIFSWILSRICIILCIFAVFCVLFFSYMEKLHPCLFALEYAVKETCNFVGHFKRSFGWWINLDTKVNLCHERVRIKYYTCSRMRKKRLWNVLMMSSWCVCFAALINGQVFSCVNLNQ